MSPALPPRSPAPPPAPRRFEQSPSLPPANFLVGVAPPSMELHRSLGEDGCGIGLDYYGYFYVNGRYFHASNLSNWANVAKPVRCAGREGPVGVPGGHVTACM